MAVPACAVVPAAAAGRIVGAVVARLEELLPLQAAAKAAMGVPSATA